VPALAVRSARHSSIRIAERYSSDELDAALKAARRAIEYCLKEPAPGSTPAAR
jgi:hypothetical protein